jgi:hypothetical protein
MMTNEPELLQGLRALAAESPQEAPPRVEERLVAEMRRRSRARRRNFWLAGASGAVAAGLAVMVWMHPAAPTGFPEDAAFSELADGFYPLPDADALSPLETAMVVRVELPMSSLRLMGVPVNGASAAQLIQADVLLGQDGLARGVRFVQ